MKDTRVYRSADIGSDQPPSCMYSSHVETTENKRCRVKYDTARLRNEKVLSRFNICNIAVQNRYHVLEN